MRVKLSTGGHLKRARKLSGQSRHLVISLVVVVFAVITAAWWMYGSSRRSTPQNSPTPSPTATPLKGNATTEPTVTPSPSPVASGQATKPTLQKSSGNAPGSYVVAGTIVAFTCEGAEGNQCNIVLTNTATSQVIRLGKKPLQNNNHGQVFASWDWTTIKGTWTVIAQASAGNSTANSSSQSLEVK